MCIRDRCVWFSGSLRVTGSGDHYFTDGNVGIGTTSPTSSLHVQGVGYFDGGESISFSDTVSDAAIVIREADFIYTRDGNNLRKLIGKSSSDVIEIGQAGTSLVDEIRLLPGSVGFTSFYNGSSETMRVTGGNVGIGTTSPAGKFNSYISATRQITHNGNGGDLSVISDNNSTPVMYIKGTGTADLLNVYDNTTEVFTILDGGNVGIGTTSPGNTLHVFKLSLIHI